MARRTFLHVGTPKSGTTYLQYVLWRRARPVMRRHGVLLPGRRATHFAAAKGVTGKRDQQRRTDVDPAHAWRDLVSQVNAWDGDALVCHELFAPATARRAARARSALHGSQVHVVLTARSLARQIPAAWQQQVRAGLATTYDEFLERLRHGDPVRDRFRRKTGKAGWFWRVQDLADIAGRWAADIPPEHVHIVTLPPDGSKPGLLWERYSSVLGVDGADIDSEVPKRNVSLGRVETELLRRVNAARDSRFSGVSRHRWTRGLLASQVLSQRAGEPIGLPEDARAWVEKRTDAMLRQLRSAGYAVVGDLDDLTAAAPPAEAGDTDAEVDEVCDWTIKRLAEHLDELRDPRGGDGHRAVAPRVGPGDGVLGILELLEHIRAAQTGQAPRPRSA